MVTGQWFYRPEEAEKKGGGSWQSRDTRELFYSFHRDEVPAESVMHKCVVHFVPIHKQHPNRKQHPGFRLLGLPGAAHTSSAPPSPHSPAEGAGLLPKSMQRKITEEPLGTKRGVHGGSLPPRGLLPAKCYL